MEKEEGGECHHYYYTLALSPSSSTRHLSRHHHHLGVLITIILSVTVYPSRHHPSWRLHHPGGQWGGHKAGSGPDYSFLREAEGIICQLPLEKLFCGRHWWCGVWSRTLECWSEESESSQHYQDSTGLHNTPQDSLKLWKIPKRTTGLHRPHRIPQESTKPHKTS